MLLLGVVSLLTPVPGGTVMIAGGLTTLICTSPKAQFCIQYMRSRLSWFNRVVFWIESKVGKRVQIMGDALKKTRPEGSEHKSTDA